MIIFGMGARIVPVFAGVTLYSTGLLTATFVLVNLGNVIRVVFQAISSVLGDFSFIMMGTSGWLEVTGMTLFCVNLWMTLRIPQEAEAEVEGEILIAKTTNRPPESKIAFKLKLKRERPGQKSFFRKARW